VENSLGDSLDGEGGKLALPPDLARRLLERFHAIVEKAVASGVQPVVLTSGRIRGAVRRFIEPALPHVAVLSFAEIGRGTAVTSVGTVKLDDE
jgi:flagellar biosynthesis protein FlhA